jgi:hypothetical protein
MSAVSVRLSEGIHEAVGELADEVGVSKSDMATLLLYFGIASVKGWQFSERTLALINADTLESYGSMIRQLAKAKPDDRVRVEKYLAELFAKLAKVFPGMG